MNDSNCCIGVVIVKVLSHNKKFIQSEVHTRELPSPPSLVIMTARKKKLLLRIAIKL